MTHWPFRWYIKYFYKEDIKDSGLKAMTNYYGEINQLFAFRCV